MKTCPHCGKEYPDDVVLCPIDQTPLEAESANRKNSTAMTKGTASRTRWIFSLALMAFVAYFIFPFTVGFYNLNEGYFLLLITVMFLGWPIVGIIVAVRMHGASILKRLSAGFLTFVALFAGAMLLPATGISPWALGFSLNFRLTKHPAQVQQWAVTAINRYEGGKLATTTNVEYWAAGGDKIEPSEIPDWVQNLWKDKPSIGIATITENGWDTSSAGTNVESLRNLTGGVIRPLKLTHCVAFSWYQTGVLVGPKDFKSAWNPGSLHEISPGIYLYAGGK
jgi:hypothetical protein